MSKILGRLLSAAAKRARPSATPLPHDSAPTLLGWYLRKGGIPLVLGAIRWPLLGSRAWPIFVGPGVHISYARLVHLGSWASIGAGTVMNAFSRQGVWFGDRVTIRENGWIQCSASPSSPGEGLCIGPRTYIGPGVILGVGGLVEIGADCQLGAGVVIIAENHKIDDEGRVSKTGVERLGIRIGDGCWIGHRVTIVDGVELGPGCVVGAGSVVTASFAAGSRLVGVPARLIGGEA